MISIKQNIIFITVDSLRCDKLGFRSGNGLTPNLDKISRDGVSFTNCFSNGSSTASSFPSFFVPDHHPFKEFSPVLAGRSFVEDLKENGYYTAGFNAKNYYVSGYNEYNKGFDYYLDYFDGNTTKGKASASKRQPSAFKKLKNSIKKPLWNIFYNHTPFVFNKLFQWYLFDSMLKSYRDVSSSRSGEILTEDIVKRLKANIPEPFFIWAHYMDVHLPYIPPKRYRPYPPLKIVRINKKMKEVQFKGRKISDELLSDLILLYDCEVKYLDFCIGTLITNLKKLGMYENTTIILTSDHGDGFYEHGRLFHASQLFDELINIPLLIKGPDFKKNEISEDLVEARDIPATINYLATGKESKKYSGMNIVKILKTHKGHEFVCAKARQAGSQGVAHKKKDRAHSFKEYPHKIYSLRTKRYKLLFDDKTNDYELYDVKKDKGETKNIFDKEDAKSKDLVDLIHILIKKHKKESEKDKIKSIFKGKKALT